MIVTTDVFLEHQVRLEHRLVTRFLPVDDSTVTIAGLALAQDDVVQVLTQWNFLLLRHS